MKKKNTIFDILSLGILIIATFYFVFKGKDLNEMVSYLRSANPVYWLLSILLVVVFICSESVIIYTLLHTLGETTKLIKCIVFSFIGFFFSCVTPSASGGQPAQLVYMNKEDLTVANSSLSLLFITLTYKLVLVFTGIMVLIIRPESLMIYLNPIIHWCYLGILLNTGVIAIIAFVIFKPVLAKHIVDIALNILIKLHIVKNKEKWIDKTYHTMEQYQDSAKYIRYHIPTFVEVLIISTIQRFALFFITALVYLSFGLRGQSLVTITLLQGMISVCVDMLPLPGGVGISESLFLIIFKGIFDKYTLSAMVISRGISYYTQLLLSASVTIGAHLYYMRKEHTKQ